LSGLKRVVIEGVVGPFFLSFSLELHLFVFLLFVLGGVDRTSSLVLAVDLLGEKIPPKFNCLLITFVFVGEGTWLVLTGVKSNLRLLRAGEVDPSLAGEVNWGNSLTCDVQVPLLGDICWLTWFRHFKGEKSSRVTVVFSLFRFLKTSNGLRNRMGDEASLSMSN